MLDNETERIFTFYNESIVFCLLAWTTKSALANVPYEYIDSLRKEKSEFQCW